MQTLDGGLDTTFGAGGKVVTNFGGVYDQIDGLAVQTDGKILAVGTGGGSNCFAIARYLPNGTLDSSFSGDGKLIISQSAGSPAVVPLSNGKIVVGFAKLGTGPWGFSLVRLNSDGSIDTTFGTGGQALINTGGTQPYVEKLLVQPDGKLVLVGFDLFGGNWDGVITRFNTDGSPDSSFGSAGFTRVNFSRQEIASPEDNLNSGLILPDGRILVGGLRLPRRPTVRAIASMPWQDICQMDRQMRRRHRREASLHARY